MSFKFIFVIITNLLFFYPSFASDCSEIRPKRGVVEFNYSEVLQNEYVGLSFDYIYLNPECLSGTVGYFNKNKWIPIIKECKEISQSNEKNRKIRIVDKNFGELIFEFERKIDGVNDTVLLHNVDLLDLVLKINKNSNILLISIAIDEKKYSKRIEKALHNRCICFIQTIKYIHKKELQLEN